jgi:hypothetical protein
MNPSVKRRQLLRFDILEDRRLLSVALLSSTALGIEPTSNAIRSEIRDVESAPQEIGSVDSDSSDVSIVESGVRPDQDALARRRLSRIETNTTPTVLPQATTLDSNATPATADLTALTETPVTTTPPAADTASGSSPRDMVKGIHNRHPEWQVDTEWVHGGNFSVETFLEEFTSQDDPSTDGSDTPTRPVQPTSPEIPATVVDQDPSTIDRPAVMQAGSHQNPAIVESTNSAESVSDGTASSAVSFDPRRNSATNSSAIRRSETEANGQSNAASPLTEAGVYAGQPTASINSLNGRGVESIGLLPVADGEVADGLIRFDVAASIDLGPELVYVDANSGADALSPQVAALHASLGGFDLPVFDWSVRDFREQVAEAVSWFASPTGIAVVSCLVVVVAAGVGCEIVRRQSKTAAGDATSDMSVVRLLCA